MLGELVAVTYVLGSAFNNVSSLDSSSFRGAIARCAVVIFSGSVAVYFQWEDVECRVQQYAADILSWWFAYTTGHLPVDTQHQVGDSAAEDGGRLQ